MANTLAGNEQESELWPFLQNGGGFVMVHQSLRWK